MTKPVIPFCSEVHQLLTFVFAEDDITEAIANCASEVLYEHSEFMAEILKQSPENIKVSESIDVLMYSRSLMFLLCAYCMSAGIDVERNEIGIMSASNEPSDIIEHTYVSMIEMISTLHIVRNFVMHKKHRDQDTTNEIKYISDMMNKIADYHLVMFTTVTTKTPNGNMDEYTELVTILDDRNVNRFQSWINGASSDMRNKGMVRREKLVKELNGFPELKKFLLPADLLIMGFTDDVTVI